jgi:hypothetical protein
MTDEERRRLETGLAYLTLALLALYVPVETWASWGAGLSNPFYLVDLIAMVLLCAGAVRSLGARPRSSPALLCAALAWSGANGWRATFGRVAEVRRGGTLDHGMAELWVVGVATALNLLCLGLSIYLVVRADRR